MKLSVKYLLAASFYGLFGMIMGMVMGAREDFTLRPVHAHLNLLGWVAIMLYGLTYELFPGMAKNRLAVWQFYVVNAGVLLLMPSLALLLLGNSAVLPVLMLGELCSVAALAIFIVNLWKARHDGGSAK
ncbi:MAG: hypothetical protein ACU841_10030 [Gammaproteobacteria bacterium]